MLYITGDTHNVIDFQKLSFKNWPQSRNLTHHDYLIVAGDFGVPWDNSSTDRKLLDWYDNRPYTVLFVDGNHENFDLLEQYPVVDKFGGKVSKVSSNIYWLHRGEIYLLGDKKVFTFGGANSVDKAIRTPHLSWWEQEMPSRDEMEHGIERLSDFFDSVDIVVTHECPESIAHNICYYYEPDSLRKYFDVLKEKITFNNWYFGHHHIDRSFEGGKFRALYSDIVEISC